MFSYTTMLKLSLIFLSIIQFSYAQSGVDVEITPQAGASDPAKHMAKVGKFVELECVSDGSDPMEWSHKGMKIRENNRIKIHVTSDKKKSHLRISDVTKDDAGDYSCSLDPLTKATAKLEVKEGTGMLRIKWDKDGKDISEGTGISINQQSTGSKTTSRLTIDSFKNSNAGHYCCYDESSQADGSKLVHLDVPGHHDGSGHGDMSKKRCRQQGGGHHAGDGHGHGHMTASATTHNSYLLTALIPFLAILYR